MGTIPVASDISSTALSRKRLVLSWWPQHINLHFSRADDRSFQTHTPRMCWSLETRLLLKTWAEKPLTQLWITPRLGWHGNGKSMKVVVFHFSEMFSAGSKKAVTLEFTLWSTAAAVARAEKCWNLLYSYKACYDHQKISWAYPGLMETCLQMAHRAGGRRTAHRRNDKQFALRINHYRLEGWIQKKWWSLDGLVQEVVEELAWASEWRREENNCERWLPPRRKSRSIVMFCFASSWSEVDPAAKPRGWCGKYLWTNWKTLERATRWRLADTATAGADRNINVIILCE